MKRSKTVYQAMLIPAVFAVVMMLAIPTSAQVAGRSQGFYLGLEFYGATLHNEVNTNAFHIKDGGSGLLLVTGYSFNEVFSLEFDLGGANYETSDPKIDARHGTFRVFAHYRFLPGRAFRPYIKGGLGGYALELDDNTTKIRIDGGGVPIGLGFDYFFSPHFSLGADVTHNFIQYQNFAVSNQAFSVGFGIDEAGAMSSVGMSLAYYF